MPAIPRSPIRIDRHRSPAWKRALAGLLDALSIGMIAGYPIAILSGGVGDTRVTIGGWWAALLVAIVLAYFYLGHHVLGGTAWDRLLGIGRPQFHAQQDLSAPNPPAAAWKRVTATLLDGLTVFLAGGYIVGTATGNIVDGGFKLEGQPAMLLFALIAAYFVIGRKIAGGTLWDRVFGIRRPQPSW